MTDHEHIPTDFATDHPSFMVRVNAAGAIDAAGHDFTPASMILSPATGEIRAIGTPEQLAATVDDAVVNEVVELPEHVVIPALINAHAHLDLSHIDPTPFNGDFAAWASMVRDSRCHDVSAIAASVKRGAQLSREGGTALIGDIAGNAGVDAAVALREACSNERLTGVSFIELFGIGTAADRAVDTIDRILREAPEDTGRHRVGLQPHAPYSCSLATYKACLDAGRPLATHLAETRDEDQFIRDAAGPLAQFLRTLGIWDSSIEAMNCSPVQALKSLLADAPWTLAHCNYVDDDDLGVLAETGAVVAYCPRASAYFGHPHHGHAAHRYRDMLERGIPVALGTDGFLCLDTPDRISVLDEMRFLHRRDGTSTRTLLRMATLHGAAALGVDPSWCTLSPGPTSGLLALRGQGVDAAARLANALEQDDGPAWIMSPSTVRWKSADRW